MKPEELKAHCELQQKIQGNECALIILQVPGKWGKRDYKYLWRGGPKVKIIASGADGYITIMGRANEILAKLEKVKY